MWTRQWSWKSDRDDAYGVAGGLKVVMAFDLATGRVRGWLRGVSLGCGLANLTAFMSRRWRLEAVLNCARIEAADQKYMPPAHHAEQRRARPWWLWALRGVPGLAAVGIGFAAAQDSILLRSAP